MQGNYSPDKEFRYLRHLCYIAETVLRWLGHFCPALHVAMQVGLYLHHLQKATLGV